MSLELDRIDGIVPECRLETVGLAHDLGDAPRYWPPTGASEK